MEGILQKVMFEVPSNHKIAKVIIDEAAVQGEKDPEFEIDEARKPTFISIKSEKIGDKSKEKSDAS